METWLQEYSNTANRPICRHDKFQCISPCTDVIWCPANLTGIPGSNPHHSFIHMSYLMTTSSHAPALNHYTGTALMGYSEASFVSELRTCKPSKDVGKLVIQLFETHVYVSRTHLCFLMGLLSLHSLCVRVIKYRLLMCFWFHRH